MDIIADAGFVKGVFESRNNSRRQFGNSPIKRPGSIVPPGLLTINFQRFLPVMSAPRQDKHALERAVALAAGLDGIVFLQGHVHDAAMV